MKLSHRHRQILDLLLTRSDEVTAGEIAAEINVSTRTVHRELSELETAITGSGLTLQKKSGKGILLQAAPDKLEAFKQTLLVASAVEYSAQDRKLFIVCTLLQESEPVKLFSLSHDLGVTVPTITNDLDELESWIQKSDLILIRRRGYGVGLSGSEANMRRMISRLARNYLDESDLFGRMEHVHSPVTRKLLELIGKPHFAKVEEALWQAEDDRLHALSESDYTYLLIHISIAVSRVQQGRAIELQAEKQSNRQSELLAHVISCLSNAIGMEFSTAEVAYLAQLLEPGDASHPNQLLPQEKLSYMEIVWKMVRNMEARSGVNYTADRSLRDGLLSHLESALKRLRAGATIRNPLLTQIRKDYEALFEGIREAVNETISDVAIPDEEVGYLVMHFGASLERQKQFRRNVRAIIVCTSGLGTSKMLAVRLTKELPQISIVGNASWFEAARIPEADYDLIISTVDLPLENEQYIKLSPLLTKEEAERLRLFIQNVTLQKEESPRSQLTQLPRDAAAERTYRVRPYVDEIVRILDQFNVYAIKQTFDSLQATLMEICRYVQQSHVIEDVEPIVTLLLQRERQSSQVIPDTSLALFHIRSELVSRPSLTLFRLQQDLVLDQITPSGVRQVLLMLGPKELSKESLEVLSEISSYLLIPEMIELLEGGTEADIKQYLSRELEEFLENKK